MRAFNRRLCSAVAIPFVIVASVLGPVNEARAALPALLLVPAMELGEALVLRSAGKVAIQAIGVAANDVSWLSAGTAVARANSGGLATALAFLGLGLFSPSTGTEEYVVAISGAPLPKSPDVPTGDEGTVNNPFSAYSKFVYYSGLHERCWVYDANGKQYAMTDNGFYNLTDYINKCTAFVRTVDPDAYIDVSEEFPGEGVSPRDLGGFYVDPVFYAVYSGLCRQGRTVCPIATGIVQPLGAVSNVSVKYMEPKDGVKRILRNQSSNTFYADVDDPDWIGLPNKNFNSPNISFKGRNSINEDTRVDLILSGQGLTINSYTQSALAQVLNRSLALNNDLQVSTAAQADVPGTIDTVAPALDTTSNPSGGTNPGNVSIQFPNDYARENTAQSMNTNLDAIKSSLTQTGDLTDPTVPDASEFENSFFKETFSPLLSWQLPAHRSQCPSVTFDYSLWGHSFHLVMDAHCTIAENQRSLVSDVMSVVWLLAALFLILGA